MKKVLIVDDTKNIRMILTKCLELEGYEVMTANDGKQAFEMMMARSFDLVFLDIKLPEIRGTEVLRRIRQNGIKTPVVIITAYATVKNAVECTNMGAVAYVQKPFSADKIKCVLKDLGISPASDSKENLVVERLVLDMKSLIEGKEYGKALEHAKKVLSIDINIPEIYQLIGNAYEGLNKKEDADRFYQLYKSY